jgi:acyl-CoA synthetase (AMP-forming)/AMP-acid ligase II
MKGYFVRDDLNGDESTFMKDGWFRTGDVGHWNADGTLSFLDRWVLFYLVECPRDDTANHYHLSS